MFPLIETAAAFAAVMLVTSLFVSAIVQVIQAALVLRPKILAGMLITVARGYREDAGLAELAEAEEKKFVDAILGHRLLHTAASVAAANGDTGALAAKIDYLHEDDLLDLVRREIAAEKSPVRAVVADMEQFTTFVRRWYDTIGATASEQYKRHMRRITTLVSCLVVVLFNVDGIHLIGDLYRDQGARDALLRQVDTIHQTAARLDEREHPRGDAGVQELRHELARTNAILDETGAGIGWQNGWILKRWDAYEGRQEHGAPRPTAARLVADAALWLVGLVFSCVMLSLGAPFWATTLGRLVNLGNAVQRLKRSA